MPHWLPLSILSLSPSKCIYVPLLHVRDSPPTQNRPYKSFVQAAITTHLASSQELWGFLISLVSHGSWLHLDRGCALCQGPAWRPLLYDIISYISIIITNFISTIILISSATIIISRISIVLISMSVNNYCCASLCLFLSLVSQANRIEADGRPPRAVWSRFLPIKGESLLAPVAYRGITGSPYRSNPVLRYLLLWFNAILIKCWSVSQHQKCSVMQIVSILCAKILE